MYIFNILIFKKKKKKKKRRKKKEEENISLDPLLAKFLACGKCSKTQAYFTVIRLFSCPIIGLISCLMQCLRLKPI
jgi:hypothetical protein